MINLKRTIDVTRQFQSSFKKLTKRYRNLKRDLIGVTQAIEAGELPGDKIAGIGSAVYKVRIKNSDIKKVKVVVTEYCIT